MEGSASRLYVSSETGAAIGRASISGMEASPLDAVCVRVLAGLRTDESFSVANADLNRLLVGLDDAAAARVLRAYMGKR